MKFTETKLKGAYIVDITPRTDDRGFFARTFCAKEFAENGLNTNIVNTNHSMSIGRGLIRGMHFQRPPFAEAKLIKCIRGAIFDVIIDIREGSPTFLQWFGIELNADNRAMLYIPEGFAHGFQSLTDETEILYQVTNFYHKECEGGIHHKEPMVDVAWKLPVGLVSEKDNNLAFIDHTFKGIRL
jgi:dTDP-4-dehydrorhamnose 3,5-epimerase